MAVNYSKVSDEVAAVQTLDIETGPIASSSSASAPIPSTSFKIKSAGAESPYTPKSSQDISWANLCFQVGKVKILDNCFGKVPSGQVCAIMGPSGAGKSSLLNVLAGRSCKFLSLSPSLTTYHLP